MSIRLIVLIGFSFVFCTVVWSSLSLEVVLCTPPAPLTQLRTRLLLQPHWVFVKVCCVKWNLHFRMYLQAGLYYLLCYHYHRRCGWIGWLLRGSERSKETARVDFMEGMETLYLFLVLSVLDSMVFQYMWKTSRILQLLVIQIICAKYWTK